jgi:hypothetical protein
MSTRTLAFLAAAMVLVVAGSVAAQDVRFNALPDTDFTKYKTYRWVKIEGTTAPDQIVDAQIRKAIDAQFAAKGVKQIDGENADLYVGYQVALSQERQWNTYNTGGGWGYGPRWGYAGGMGTATTTSTTINIGTLGVDMYDSATKQLVWRGAASKTIDENAKPDKRQKNLDKAMAKLFKNYPPPPPKKK